MRDHQTTSDAAILDLLAEGYGSEDIAVMLVVPRQRVSGIIRSLRAAGRLPLKSSAGGAA